MFQQGKGKLKVCWTSIQKTKVFLCTVSAFSILVYSSAKFDLADRGVRQPVQPRTFCARLLVFDETLAQPHFALVNCSHVVVTVY